ncbi:4-hydroxyacetophenone monooxygenase [Mycobacterium sp. CBMA 234]|uniref:flavin-containing monooxygenase n=1 Tax=Mycolicibacterium sp. CBMA 234 TaxID=1918495 RepID=UPI0012DDFBB6|nr:NAD(P)/FAD-dependent oxidoreductase [Mycolicibacterium sp. CBMA 234]MUL62980.1 4-hydroxyacetophenone monooxygenase [Mycolicibacterium sp. CBMA 234]
MKPTTTHVAIIGSGFAGLGAAIQLRRAGFDVTILERAGDVGGVWRDNNYPGAACDVQSHVYSYSFAPNPDWNHTFARQAEIQTYLKKVADDYGLQPHLRLNTPVDEARWDSAQANWRLNTAGGEIVAEHMVVATGALADPVVPQLPGLDRFAGDMFHSARWDHSVDLSGKRVAVIGAGASAIQFVPAIQPKVKRLTLFQRTAPWVMPRHDAPISGWRKALFRALPVLQYAERTRIFAERELMVYAFRFPVAMKIAERAALKHLESQVSDPVLRAKLTPDYRLGCKRILLSNDYWAALGQTNADVVTSGIREITANGVIDNDGVLHAVDAIILGTGFKTDGLPLTDRIYGPDGQTMAQAWHNSPRAYLGTTVAGFPNAYLMHGPNIGLGHNSVIEMFENQTSYVVDAVRYCRDHGVAEIEPTPQAQNEFVAEVDKLTEGSVWTSGGCTSWYLDSTGRNSNLWPSTTLAYRFKTRQFRPADHTLTSARELTA